MATKNQLRRSAPEPACAARLLGRFAQRIIDLVRVTKGTTLLSLTWRIALLERFWQARHPPRYAAYLNRRHPDSRLTHGTVGWS